MKTEMYMCWKSCRALRIALLKFQVFSSCRVHAVKVSGFVDGGVGAFGEGRGGVSGFVVVSLLQENYKLFHIFNNHLL